MVSLRRRGTRIGANRPGKYSSLIASAARIKRTDFTSSGRRGPMAEAKWQREAWDFYDSCGELRFGAGWMANSLSRATLFIAEGDTDVPEPTRVDEGDAVDYLNALFNGPAGQAGMLGALGLHFTVPGSCYLVSFRDPDTGEVQWVTASTQELTKKDSGLVLDRGDNRPIPLSLPVNDAQAPGGSGEDWVLRMWQSHPRRWWEADSPTRAALPVLREMASLDARVQASNDSRLAGNGILMLPSEVTFPPAAETDQPIHDDPLMAHLIEGMVTPMQDRDSAAAVVPILLQAPGELLDKAKWLYPDSKLDERIDPMRERGIQRLSLSLDMPPEALLGLGRSSHWNAWQISDEAVRLYVSPKLATICDALTTGYLWPLLERDRGDRARDFTIWFETSQLTERPDRGPDAQETFDRGELSGDSLRKYRGFTDDDAPTEQERNERVLLKLAESNPQLAPQILELLGIIAPGQLTLASPVKVPSQREEQPALPPGEDDQGPPPEPEDEVSAEDEPEQVNASVGIDECLVDVCHLAVLQVLDWAGRRLKKRSRGGFSQIADVPPEMAHTHVQLTEADLAYLFGETAAHRTFSEPWRVAKVARPEIVPLVPALDVYVRQLMLTREHHRREYIPAALRQYEARRRKGMVLDA